MGRKSDPWLEIENMRQEMDRIMDETVRMKIKPTRGRNQISLWQPLADLYESRTHLIIEMELPGVLQEDVNLEVQADQLIVYGEKKLEKDAAGSAYQMLERSYGPFSRVFFLPEEADCSRTSAVFKNGVLTISIPKAAPRQKKSFRIQIS